MQTISSLHEVLSLFASHLYVPDDGNVCNTCQHRDASNVGRCCLDRVIGDRTWSGSANELDVSHFIRLHCDDITITFETARNENEAIKYYFELEVRFYCVAPDGDDVHHTTARFYMPPITLDVDNLDLPDIVRQFLEKIDGFSGQNSGWSIVQINYLRLCWGRYRPLVAGTFILMPKFIAAKKALVNIQCHDDENCFQYSVLARMNIIKFGSHDHKSRPFQYKQYLRMLNMDSIQKPVTLSSIDKFEKQNAEISINVLYLDDNRDVVPVRTSKFCNQRRHHVTLLLLTDREKLHYTCVQCLSRLIGDRTNHQHKTYVCHYCLHPFSKEDVLLDDVPICGRHQLQQILYPKPGKEILMFNKFHFQFRVLFAIYADFESFLQKSDDHSDVHVPSGFCVVTTGIFQEHDYRLLCYMGENVMDEFFEHMQREELRIRTIPSADVPMNEMTTEQRAKHDATMECIICNRMFTADRVT